MSNLEKRPKNGPPLLRSMMEDFWNANRFLEPPFYTQETLPAVNIKEKDNSYEVEVAAPGYKKEDFKVTTENGMLVITAETETEQREEDENYARREFSRTSFSRSFTLPDDVKEGEIKAHYEDGLLRIKLKKTDRISGSKKEIKID